MKSRFSPTQDKIIAERYTVGLETAEQIANSFGVYKQSVLNSLKRMRISRRRSWLRAHGDGHPRWKGGWRKVKGYLHIFMPDHHLARNDGYVPYHRLVLENKLGRKLLSGEVVNHIDGNKLNNLPENLEVFENNGRHMSQHVYQNFKRGHRGKFVKLAS